MLETLQLLAERHGHPAPASPWPPFVPSTHPLARIETALMHGGTCDACAQWVRNVIVTPCAHILCLDCVSSDSRACVVRDCRHAYKQELVSDPKRCGMPTHGLLLTWSSKISQLPRLASSHVSQLVVSCARPPSLGRQQLLYSLACRCRREDNLNPKWDVPVELIEWQPVSHQQGAAGADAGDWQPEWVSTTSSKAAYLLSRLRRLGIIRNLPIAGRDADAVFRVAPPCGPMRQLVEERRVSGHGDLEAAAEAGTNADRGRSTLPEAWAQASGVLSNQGHFSGVLAAPATSDQSAAVGMGEGGAVEAPVVSAEAAAAGSVATPSQGNEPCAGASAAHVSADPAVLPHQTEPSLRGDHVLADQAQSAALSADVVEPVSPEGCGFHPNGIISTNSASRAKDVACGRQPAPASDAGASLCARASLLIGNACCESCRGSAAAALDRKPGWRVRFVSEQALTERQASPARPVERRDKSAAAAPMWTPERAPLRSILRPASPLIAARQRAELVPGPTHPSVSMPWGRSRRASYGSRRLERAFNALGAAGAEPDPWLASVHEHRDASLIPKAIIYTSFATHFELLWRQLSVAGVRFQVSGPHLCAIGPATCARRVSTYIGKRRAARTLTARHGTA